MLDRLIDVLLTIINYIKPLDINLPFEESIVFRLGKVHRQRGQGVVWLIPAIDQNHKARKDIKSHILHAQAMLTEDGTPITIRMGCIWRLVDVRKFLLEIQDDDDTLYTQAMCTLAELIRKAKYDELLTKEWHTKLYTTIKRRLAGYGIEVIEFEIIELVKTRLAIRLYNDV